MAARPSIERVLERNTPALLGIPGVVGTAQGEVKGKPCILVFIKERDPVVEQQIPAVLEGHPVKIEAVGEIRPLTP
jgi:hypothetical protein